MSQRTLPKRVLPKRAVKKAAPKKAAPKKAAPKKAAVKVTAKKAAVVNKVPKVKPLKCRALDESQLVVWAISSALHGIMPTDVKKDGVVVKTELRKVDDRTKVLFNEELGLDPRSAYTQKAEVDKILAFFKKHTPKDCLPAKWARRLYPVSE